jgi:predicted GH43/DUF377 family glycosyl hydrolase
MIHASVNKRFIFLAILSTILPKIFAQNTQLPSWALGEFIRPIDSPIIVPNSESKFYCPMRKQIVKWEESDTFNPAAVVKDGKIYVLYRAEDNSAVGIGERTSRIGLAESSDGIKMTLRNKPVMYPNEDNMKIYDWPGGCEDPRVCQTENGLYVMTYTSWNRKTPRLCIATSKDLVNWQKHGPAFAKAYRGRFKDMACKSGSIVTKLKDDKMVIAKIKGNYLMYWGENQVNMATSKDLINWEPLLEKNGDLKAAMHPRKGYFDSALTECGPPALLTDKGILLLYNGKNSKGEDRDFRFKDGSYCAGQALFDKNNPSELIARLDLPFFKPSADFEKSGQYPDGTVFIEGLAFFHKKWFLYYGCADSKVGVAIYNPKE